ncbi:LamB/YcsF family protein [Agromyces sp. SYSU K20354]|uniref:LamB/YcsF family protein n=1 Tax=Agromyces cavernae TaxID=2898659 RepID=UPI001E4A1DC7|nr:5-oxoprolinase subunit PxpA [Agromyces cavernae]MCD2441614.1 LamB/YcsF family protein [Agromyces cavernae]
MRPAIDLNSDLGESFGAWRVGDDETMFTLVSSANVACGYHAGDAMTMAASARLAARHGVSLGAHPGYRDLVGFGRRPLETTPAEIAAELLAQLGSLDGVARAAGARVRYVKAHGALYHRLSGDAAAARAFAEAVAAYDATLPILGQPMSELEQAAREAGLAFAREAFVDRGYVADGSLAPRGEPGAVIDDPAAASDRALELVETGGIAADDGSRVELAPDSLCLHGDTPGAVAIGRAVRAALERAGYRIEAFA